MVGVIGHFAAGKDTVAEYLNGRYGFRVVSMYQPLRNLASRIYGDPTRNQIYDLGKNLSEAFGKDLFIWWCEHTLKLLDGRVVIKDTRFINEVAWLSDVAKLLVFVECPPEVAFERVKARGRRGDPSDLESLKRMWENEGELESIKKLPIKNLVVIPNDDTLEALYLRLDKLVEKVTWYGDEGKALF